MRQVAGAHVEHADVGAADRAGQLDAGVDRHFLSAEQADLAAEERKHVGAGRGNAARRGSGPVLAKLKTPAPSRKNDALLGKQQREARQVDLARVDFGFAEVGVEGRGQLQARA